MALCVLAGRGTGYGIGRLSPLLGLRSLFVNVVPVSAVSFAFSFFLPSTNRYSLKCFSALQLWSASFGALNCFWLGFTTTRFVLLYKCHRSRFKRRFGKHVQTYTQLRQRPAIWLESVIDEDGGVPVAWLESIQNARQMSALFAAASCTEDQETLGKLVMALWGVRLLDLDDGQTACVREMFHKIAPYKMGGCSPGLQWLLTGVWQAIVERPPLWTTRRTTRKSFLLLDKMREKLDEVGESDVDDGTNLRWLELRMERVLKAIVGTLPSTEQNDPGLPHAVHCLASQVDVSGSSWIPVVRAMTVRDRLHSISEFLTEILQDKEEAKWLEGVAAIVIANEGGGLECMQKALVCAMKRGYERATDRLLDNREIIPDSDTQRRMRKTAEQSGHPGVLRLFFTTNYLCRRFVIKRRLVHRSATSIILEATDVISSEAVAIKFISEKDQFDAEISARKLSCGNEGEADDKVREHTTIVPIIETSATLGSWHSRLEKWQSLPSSSWASKFDLSRFPCAIIMPLADRDLMMAMMKERIHPDGVRRMFGDLGRCLKHIHSEGIIHGDVKPLNMVRRSQDQLMVRRLCNSPFVSFNSQVRLCDSLDSDGHGDWRLIDFDASVAFRHPVGRKANNSSAFAPPEAFFEHEEAEGVVHTLQKDSNGKGKTGYQELPAGPTFDVWGFGVSVYFALCWKSLLVADNADNLRSAHELKRLFTWDLKQLDRAIGELRVALAMPERKCDQITALKACDLLSKLLQPMPERRPQSFDGVMEHVFFCDAGKWWMSDVHVGAASGRLDLSRIHSGMCDGTHPLNKHPLEVAAFELQSHQVHHLLFDDADTGIQEAKHEDDGLNETSNSMPGSGPRFSTSSRRCLRPVWTSEEHSGVREASLRSLLLTMEARPDEQIPKAVEVCKDRFRD